MYSVVCIFFFSLFFFFFKQKTAYEMRISDWSSDVCSSDLDRQCRGAFLRLHIVADDGIGRRAAAGLADTDTDPRDQQLPEIPGAAAHHGERAPDRKSDVEGKSVSVRVDHGGSRIIKKKTHNIR